MFETFCDFLCNKTKKFITVEVNPPHGASLDSIIKDIRKHNLHEKVSGFSCTDNPLAKLKMSGVLSAIKLQQTFGKPVLATMSMRDKNKLSLQSTLLGANDFDLRCILALTGDPAKYSDQPEVKGVLERDSTLLLSIIYHLNNGVDYSNKPLNPSPKPIYPFAVSNSYAKDIKKLQKRMVKKLDYGARAIITQPVYDINSAKELLALFEEAKEMSIRDTAKEAQMVLGQFPIVRAKTANFIDDKVPGISVPKEIIDEMNLAAMDSETKEQEVGFSLSKQIFDAVMKAHGKVHLMTHNRFDLCANLIGG
ncbi:MAG: methylenetetrahydrofolate reductase [Sulfurovum sp.]|nr:methylenetetrahydrofolate reductase [Sulfurovum sp.]MCB4750528.1 methylenetetrahydrofolate reductase [Sulfurovum sp.]MCB4751663.1 methylenetetrahydrofolate reductase [Sulfurovum sp.]MCB4753831.1 methylenetetrahydrofolate reductase [Sulfurovum sp.]MCB4754482.1 methylenetetrahydrofolate reductase [Sulfurovum sp.]